ncbi:MAG: hemerythrin domain-containing protein [Melioribacteraceae bacterium]
MKRHFGLVEFSKDHHQALILAQICKTNSPRYKGMRATIDEKADYTLKMWETELKPHFEREEKYLIPISESKTEKLKELCARIILEHEQIEKLISKIAGSEGLEIILDEFGNLLDNHVRFEEREWFEEIQKELTVEEIEHLAVLVQMEIESTKQSCRK